MEKELSVTSQTEALHASRHAGAGRRGYLEIVDVSKSFASRDSGSPAVIRDLDLTVQESEFVCVLGPSGCGKSTLLHMVAGFEKPTSGQILLDGDPVAGPGADRGVVFQSTEALYEWLTSEGNVQLALKLRGVPKVERKDRADSLLELVGLQGQQHKTPAQMSGGMRQRLQIARTLALEPEMLLMDEPFGALDAQTRRTMQSELSTLWNQNRVTVLFVTHDIEEALTLADKIFVMTAGPYSKIGATFENKLPRPRERSDAFAELWRAIDEEISRQVSRGPR